MLFAGKQFTTTGYATAAQYCAEYGITAPADNSTDDLWIEALLEAASQIVDNECGWDFRNEASATYSCTPTSPSYLALPKLARTITSVHMVDLSAGNSQDITAYLRVDASAQRRLVDGAGNLLVSKVQPIAGGVLPAPASYRLDVLGSWGFATVPAIIVKATIATARTLSSMMTEDDFVSWYEVEGSIRKSHSPEQMLGTGLPVLTSMPLRLSLAVRQFRRI